MEDDTIDAIAGAAHAVILKTNRSDLEKYFTSLPQWKTPDLPSIPDGVPGDPAVSEGSKNGKTEVCTYAL